MFPAITSFLNSSTLHRRRTPPGEDLSPQGAAQDRLEAENPESSTPWSESRASTASSGSSRTIDGHRFPRDSYELQAACHAAWVARTDRAERHLEFSARVASTQWEVLTSTGSLSTMDVDLFKLAVLDLFFLLYVTNVKIQSSPISPTAADLSAQTRRERDKPMPTYAAWRAWADDRVHDVVHLVSRRPATLVLRI